jgi:phage tail sheath protein FI
MPSKLMTPGVYIEEINAFPGSAVAVETAVPVFIGYTEKAERNGKSLLLKPTRVTSFAEYVEIFGAGFNPKFKITDAPAVTKEETFVLGGKQKLVQINPNNSLYFYSCIRMFYLNGGSNCYIMSVGTYGDKPAGIGVDLTDFMGSNTKPNVFDIIEKEYEPTLLVMPDVISKGKDCYALYQLVLQHCAKTQSRFGIFDVVQSPAQTSDQDILDFRNGIGSTSLNYGAAYYPWLKTSIIQSSEVDFTNIDPSNDLATLLTENEAKSVVENMKKMIAEHTKNKGTEEQLSSLNKNIHQSLKASSPTYVKILEEIRSKMNLLPPSAAMAGIYSLIDSSRGVWKSPANVSVAMVNAPSINISHQQQEQMNVDVIGGKSINVIRPFPGIGTLVWGARTLDGNSQDWRYINVRRTMIMIEQSLKLATRAYVFEPNDSGTWVTLRSMMNNFLFNLWKLGALAGSSPEQAYDIQVGLGTTMTPTDILDGILRVSIKVAVVRPAEFIVITFQQQQQQS